MRARKIQENNNVEVCELLKSHVLVYTEDLKQERKHCEELQKEIRAFKQKIDEQGKDMRAITSHLRACLALVDQNSRTLRYPVTHPSQPVDEIQLREKKSYPKEI